MLATLIPLFDDNMFVCAYSVFARKENHFLNPNYEGGARYDGAGTVHELEVVSSMGVGTLSGGKEVFVPVNQFSIYAEISLQCTVPANKVVLLMDNTIVPNEQYIKRVKELKSQGYKLAIRKLQIADFEPYKDIIGQCDYILLNHSKIDISKAKIYFSQVYPNVKLIAVNVESQEDYEVLKEDGGYDLYEGSFFRMPVKKSETEVNPLKVNYVELLNVVNAPDFDLQKAADVIGKDPALVISLLEMVNRMALNSDITSIRHAAAMLGQKELKRWINTAVTKELCSDKPSEITRLSMIRAKFAEGLAQPFEMAMASQELFIMGLFSAIDIMLDKTMEEALNMVQVSKNVREALLENKGDFAKILNFIRRYEDADWTEVSRLMVLDNIDMDEVYEAYLNALKWYRDLFPQK
ncbi:MAG: HDOD domain-containing protein [Butyrivibrio sp.]|jgi:EAL and modified HD-GYP domain-containing signal transduction protein|uniref:EAL and HDOD domain-containing protein n=1 Tax=Butyrivibrio sp. TaxID=28121 RepID=UPI0025BFB501|nr:HDOD domain-containing protein [Butyrivibrio sp.]MBQ6588338.1 HDOD domain-containing protein [Butyrivibrio sp.]